MLKDVSRARLAGAWCATVIVVGACGVVGGAPLTISNGNLLLATCLVPAAVLLLVWRGAPPIAIPELLSSVNRPSPELLSSVNRPSKEGRP
jgi:hypothetical protein